MKNIETLLQENGIDIAEEKKKSFTDSFNTEYKTIADYTKQIEKISKLNKELDDKNNVINELNAQIKELSNGTVKLQELEKKVQEYEQAESNRLEHEKAIQLETELQARFDKVTADKKFKHEFIKTGVYDVFKKALSDEKNKAKGDNEIFSELEKDNDWYENPQKPVNIQSTGSSMSQTKATFPNFF